MEVARSLLPPPPRMCRCSSGMHVASLLRLGLLLTGWGAAAVTYHAAPTPPLPRAEEMARRGLIRPAPRCVVSSARPRLLPLPLLLLLVLLLLLLVLLLHRSAMVHPAFHHACRMLSPSKASSKRLHHSFGAVSVLSALVRPINPSLLSIKCHPRSVAGILQTRGRKTAHRRHVASCHSSSQMHRPTTLLKRESPMAWIWSKPVPAIAK